MWKPTESCTREELIQKIKFLEEIIAENQKETKEENEI